MYLKRIELEGFKSFADRTVIPVERGLTGIVGPNGCGKSNVVDALLWVLGERSAKALRADSMGDVIFKGAEGRPAAPYAMVEVVLGDPDGKVVEPGGEVAVGRRLFASGESEFLLQGRKVRRRDVREILLDTGLGVRGYMVLAQGKIDAVLAANAAERRSVFEEAAGISRYKARRHEASLKLTRVGQDLERVEDVLREVGRAVRSLRLQAGKAKRWLEIRDRYRELRVRLAVHDVEVLARQERERAAEAERLEAEAERLKREREESEARRAELEREEAVLRERHDALRAEAAEARERVAALEERSSGLEARAAETVERLERDRARLEEGDGGVGEGDELEALARELEARRAAEAAAERRVAEAEAVFARARGERDELRRRAEALRSEVLAALAERTRHHNAMAEAAHRRSEAAGALASLERRCAEFGEEAEAVRRRLDEREAELAAARAEADRLAAEVAGLVERRDLRRAELEGCREAAHDARRRAAAARTRFEALRAVEEEQPGVSPELRRLRERAGDDAGWLLEGIEVAPPWDRLVEDLLGRMQLALWVRDRAVARDLELEGGVVDCFFPVTAVPEPMPTPAGARPLAEVVRGDDERRAALLARLGPVFLVEDAAVAARLAEAHPGALFLAASGELHAAGHARRGILTEDGAGPLARRNERARAEADLERAALEEERAEALETRVAAALAEVEGELAAAEERLRAAEAARDDLEARLVNERGRVEALERELRGLAAEEAEARLRAEEAARVEAEAEAARDAAEARRERAAGELAGLEGEVQAAEAAADAASHALQEARLEAGRLAQETEHLAERLASRREEVERRVRERDALRREVAELEETAGRLTAEAEAARVERSALLERLGGLLERVQEAAAQLARARSALEAERARRQGEGGWETVAARRQEVALELQRARMERDGLLGMVREEFGQDLEDLARSLGVDPAAPLGEQEDVDAVRAELAELKRRFDALGSVNLEAVEELAEREERLAFLERERDDLLAARRRLERTMEDLDAQCRERFLDTFEKVRSHFEQIFRRLFRGGRAELALEEGVDPLTAGIEISVRPPGKELRSINLLSGGERTLTALALLLAVFRSRPSPFCLLDEVDAALDDANVERFLDVLHDFTRTTQFLVVTHNRITMARCERLFGVTMRKRGVSLVVSVELSELPEGGDGAPDLSTAREVDPVAARRGSDRPRSVGGGGDGAEAALEAGA